MAKKSTKPASPFEGRWHIVSMTTWDEDYFNEEAQAFIEFGEEGTGRFQFGHVQRQIDCRTATREGRPAVEFSWEGGDGADGTPLTGRGWAIFQGGELSGMIFIHLGDDSGFVAKNATQKKATRRK